MTSNLEKEKECRIAARKALKGLENRKIGTQAIIEIALERASISKQTKILMMIELTEKTTDGEF